MRNVDEALSCLRDMAGLPSLALDAAGQVELTFFGQTRVLFAKVDATSFELQTDLRYRGAELSRTALAKLLTLNHFGGDIGWGQVSLDPRDKVVCYGRHVDVGPLDAESLEKLVSSFLHHAAALDSAAAARELTAEPQESPPVQGGMDVMLRI